MSAKILEDLFVEEIFGELFINKLEREAERKKYDFLKAGKYVRKECIPDWNKYVADGVQDFYNAQIVEASVRVMKSLSDGKTPEEAMDALSGLDITFYMAGCMANAVSYFHPRGEEFRGYWEKR